MSSKQRCETYGCKRYAIEDLIYCRRCAANNNIELDWSKLPNSNYIYFLYAPSENLIKIGRTKNLKRRLRILELENATKVKVELSFNHQPELEQMLHEYFAQDRQHGEWFKYSESIKFFIKTFKEYGDKSLLLIYDYLEWYKFRNLTRPY